MERNFFLTDPDPEVRRVAKQKIVEKLKQSLRSR